MMEYEIADHNGLLQAINRELVQCGRTAEGVVNRPLYPVILFFNRPLGGETGEKFFGRMEDIWAQAKANFLRYSYRKDTAYRLLRLSDAETAVEEQAFIHEVELLRRARGYFKSMMNLSIYHVLDTSAMASVEEFETAFNLITYIRSLLPDAHRTMLIVLLNDSLACRTLADGVRDFLAGRQEYESTVVISTRARNREEYTMEELYLMVPDVILATNSGANDDEEHSYERMTDRLYEHRTQTVAYRSKEKPTELIAYQLGCAIAEELCGKIRRTEEMTYGDLQEKLQLQPGRELSVFRDVMKTLFRDPNVQNYLGREAIQRQLAHLPMRGTAIRKRIKFDRITYTDFSAYTYPDVLKGLAQNLSEQMLRGLDRARYRDIIEQYLRQKLSVFDLVRLSEEAVRHTTDGLYQGSVRETGGLLDYMEDNMRENLRKNFLYPTFREALLSLRRQALQTADYLLQVRQEFARNVPPDLTGQIGDYYASLVHDFVEREQEENYLSFLCETGCGKRDIYGRIFACFTDLLRVNRELFSLPFVEEWERRLNTAGDRVYREIGQAVMSNLDEHIMLSGSYPVDPRLHIFMFHALDDTTGGETKLATYLRQSVLDTSYTLFVNTNCDDFLSSIRFIACDGDKLRF